MNTKRKAAAALLLAVAFTVGAALPASAAAGDKVWGGDPSNNMELGTNDCNAVAVITRVQGQPTQTDQAITVTIQGYPKAGESCRTLTSIVYVDTRGVLRKTAERVTTGSATGSVSAIGQRCYTLTKIKRDDGSYWWYYMRRGSTLAACSGVIQG